MVVLLMMDFGMCMLGRLFALSSVFMYVASRSLSPPANTAAV